MLIFTACSQQTDKVGPAETAPPGVTVAISPTAAASDSITLENYDKLETGMTYEEVVRVLGPNGAVDRFEEINGVKLVSYKWKGENFKRIFCSFRNDKLTNKSASGIGSEADLH